MEVSLNSTYEFKYPEKMDRESNPIIVTFGSNPNIEFAAQYDTMVVFTSSLWSHLGTYDAWVKLDDSRMSTIYTFSI